LTTDATAEHLEAEAAAWAARLDAGSAYPQELDAWLAQEPRHAGALLRAQAALALFAPEADAHANANANAEDDKVAEAKPVRKRRAAWFTGAAALAASIAAALVWFGMPGEHYQTQVGEVRSLALEDGSSLSLDADSRIEVAYGSAFRDIHLQSGKALFRAVHRPDRPFRVIVDDILVTDIGTAFQVIDDAEGNRVEVLVTEGSVRVAYAGGQVDLVAGQRAAFPKSGATSRIDRRVLAPEDIDRALAWRDGRLDLAGETLASAVAEINRHSRLRVHIADPALAREPLYGSFRLDDATGFAHAAAASLSVAVHVSSGAIVIGDARK
jgi:transmembrane sensor